MCYVSSTVVGSDSTFCVSANKLFTRFVSDILAKYRNPIEICFNSFAMMENVIELHASQFECWMRAALSTTE